MIDSVIEFTSNAEAPFTLAEALEKLGPEIGRLQNSKEHLENALHNDSWVFFDKAQDCFVPRHLFFKGKKFLVFPTPLERSKGFLIPGHRFMPFVQRHLEPSNYRIKKGRGSDYLEWRQVALTMNQLQVYYSLFDSSRTIECLISEDTSNSEKLLKKPSNPNCPIKLWVLDIANLLEGQLLNVTLEVTVVDWREGDFTIAPKSNLSSPNYELKRNHWCRSLERVMLKHVFDELGPMTDVTEQLALAFFRGPKALWKTPQLHIGGFLAHLEKVSFTRVNGVPLFWRLGESPEDAIFEHLQSHTTYSGTLDSIDAILFDVGCSLGEAELEAYMRDQLFEGGSDLDLVLERAFKHRGLLTFTSMDQQSAFKVMVSGLWDQVVKNYNRFADQSSGKCRNECLAIMDNVVCWMGQLDKNNVAMDLMPKKEFVALSSLITMLTHTVTALNHQADKITRAELKALVNALAPLKSQADQLMKVIDDKLFTPVERQTKYPQFRVIEGGLSNEN